MTYCSQHHFFFHNSNVFVRTLAPGARAGVGAPAHGMCTRLGARSAHGSAVCGTLHEIKKCCHEFWAPKFVGSSVNADMYGSLHRVQEWGWGQPCMRCAADPQFV